MIKHYLKTISLKHYAIFIILCFLCSCATTRKIPADSDWQLPDLSKVEGCGNISGTYRYSETLLKCLFQFKGRPSFDTVVIDQKGEGVIEISAMIGDQVFRQKTLSKAAGDFSCKNGWVKVCKSNPFIGEATIVGGEFVTVSFGKIDGALFVKSVEWRIGACLPIPLPLLYLKDTKWEKFQEE